MDKLFHLSVIHENHAPIKYSFDNLSAMQRSLCAKIRRLDVGRYAIIDQQSKECINLIISPIFKADENIK